MVRTHDNYETMWLLSIRLSIMNHEVPPEWRADAPPHIDHLHASHHACSSDADGHNFL